MFWVHFVWLGMEISPCGRDDRGRVVTVAETLEFNLEVLL